MFLVINKEKICAYIVSVLTVCFLFIIASSNNFDEKKVETSSNIYNTNVNINEENDINKKENDVKNNIVPNRKE